MIAQFPDPYPDELLYSVVARCVERMGFPTAAGAALELFGRRHVVPAVELPNGIDFLVSRLPPGHHYTSEGLIQNHTLFPLYAPFVPARSLAAIHENMKSGEMRTTALRSGIAAGGVQPTLLFRSCPRCNEESTRQYGEIYWHRTHQIPGVEVCPIHHLFLQETDARKRSPHSRHVFIAAQNARHRNEMIVANPHDATHALLIKIAEGIAWLLTHNGIMSRGKDLRENYRARLREKNFVTLAGRICLVKLRDAVIDFWSPKLLKRLQCDIPDNAETGWLGRLTRSKRDSAIAPLRHLVLMTFLRATPEDFFCREIPRRPQEGPFACINSTCAHRNQLVIHGFAQRNNNYATTFTFKCPHCGHASSRSQDGRDIRRILDYGPLWETRLQQLWADSNLSLLAASKQLGTDISTIKRHAVKLGLKFPRLGPRKIEQGNVRVARRVRVSANGIEAKRQIWLEDLNSNPGLGRKEVRMKNAAVHAWLYRNDKEWLQAHLPPRQLAKANFRRIDWNSRDERLAAEVTRVAHEWKSATGKPRRVTVTAIGHELGVFALISKKIHKLPRTKAVLAQVVETTRDFALRRIVFASQEFIARSEVASLSDVKRISGIGSYVCRLAGVEEALLDAVRTIHNTVAPLQILEPTS